MAFENKSVCLKAQETDLKDFCRKTKRPVDSSRLQVHAVKDNQGGGLSDLINQSARKQYRRIYGIKS